jgi:hypothetical protein
MNYVTSLVQARLSGPTCQLVAGLAAAVFLAVELWTVSSALGDQGASLCPTRVTTSEQGTRAIEQPCLTERLGADVSGRSLLALHLAGNCQAERRQTKMAPMNQVSEGALEVLWPACSVVIGS